MSSSACCARYLIEHRSLFEGKDCLDMGCGSGVLGIVMLQHGARSVAFAELGRFSVYVLQLSKSSRSGDELVIPEEFDPNNSAFPHLSFCF